MTAKEFYTYLYRLLDKVTPLKADCGKLCDGACCQGDGEEGMYLFPFEEVMFEKEDSWMKIYDSNFYFMDKPVKIAICKGSCNRKKRPLSCRIFPLFQNEKGKITADIRGRGVCPLVTAEIPLDEYNPEFIKNVSRVFKILNKNEITRKYVEETIELIKETESLNDIFLK